MSSLVSRLAVGILPTAFFPVARGIFESRTFSRGRLFDHWRTVLDHLSAFALAVVEMDARRRVDCGKLQINIVGY